MALDMTVDRQLLELVWTDHSSLSWILSQDDVTDIRQRWATVLAQFNMTKIARIPGKDNIVADALSRYPQENGLSYEHLDPVNCSVKCKMLLYQNG